MNSGKNGLLGFKSPKSEELATIFLAYYRAFEDITQFIDLGIISLEPMDYWNRNYGNIIQTPNRSPNGTGAKIYSIGKKINFSALIASAKI